MVDKTHGRKSVREQKVDACKESWFCNTSGFIAHPGGERVKGRVRWPLFQGVQCLISLVRLEETLISCHLI